MAKPKIKRTERVILTQWAENPTKGDWQNVYGRNVVLGQQANGTWFIRIENLNRWAAGSASYYRRTAGQRITGSTTIKIKDSADFDTIMDALMMARELINKGEPLSSLTPKDPNDT